MRWTRLCAVTMLLGALQAVPGVAATIADSLDQWSSTGTQGQTGWFNGYYNLTTDADSTYAPADFQAFVNDGSNVVDTDGANHWNGTSWQLYRDTTANAGVETGPWTMLDSNFSHPNGLNSAPPTSIPGAVPEEHWTIRRWVSNFAGEASLISRLADQNPNCGTGTTARLFHNGVPVSSIVTSSPAGTSATVGRTLAIGDVLDLALLPLGVDGNADDPCDGSFFRLTVTDEPPPPPPVPPLADSSDDWSTTGTQGERNWFNGYFNLSQDGDGVYQAGDFIPFRNEAGPAGGPTDPDGNHWTGTQWDLTQAGTGPWTELGRNTTHPNGTNSAPNEEHWTIRRWVATDLTKPTALELTWEMAKTNLNGAGVGGALFVNGTQVDNAVIAGGDGTGVTRKFYVNANPGDVIDLALTPDGNDGADGSRNRLTVRTNLPAGPLYNPGPAVADSQTEFSETQGDNGWFYGYYDLAEDANQGDGVYQPADFKPFLNDGSNVVSNDPDFGAWKDTPNHWDGAKWDVLENGSTGHGPWTELTASGGHPAANAQGDAEVHWAVRRWVSDVSGEFAIDGLLGKGGGGDGTVGRIFRDGVEIWSGLVNNSSLPVDVDVTLAAGTVLDFAIDPDGAKNYNVADPNTVSLINDGADGTTFWFRIGQRLLFQPVGNVPGDFNGDGQLTAVDIDELSSAVRSGSGALKFDLNGDGSVSPIDREIWVNDLKKTYFGDANLDGEFNSSDFVFVFTLGQYEDGVAQNSNWASGDWDGDSEFSTTDFVTAFQAGGFEQGPRAAVASVPEPSALCLAGLALLGFVARRRR